MNKCCIFVSAIKLNTKTYQDEKFTKQNRNFRRKTIYK